MEKSFSLCLKSIAILKGHQDRVWDVAWDPEGKTLASCGTDKTIKFWGENAKGQYEIKHTIPDAHTQTIRSICWSPDSKMIASAGFDALINLWLRQGNTFECVFTLEGHENEVKSVQWDKEGNYIASCSRDKTVWVWEKDEGFEYSCSGVLNGHTQDVKHVCWIPDTTILASCGYDDTIKFWIFEDEDWICRSTLTGHDSTVWCISFTKDGKYMASVSDDTTIKIWMKNEDKKSKNLYNLMTTLSGYHDRAIYSCSWNNDGTLLVTGGGDDKINIFRLEETNSYDILPTLTLLESVKSAHSMDVNCVAFHPFKNLIASGGDDMIIKIWTVNEEY